MYVVPLVVQPASPWRPVAAAALAPTTFATTPCATSATPGDPDVRCAAVSAKKPFCMYLEQEQCVILPED